MVTYFKQLQNAGPLLNIHQTSRLVSLGSGKICMCRVHIIFRSLFGSAVDERVRNNCMRIKCLVHIFSGSFGSAMDKRTRNIVCALSVKFVYLAAQWLEEKSSLLKLAE